MLATTYVLYASRCNDDGVVAAAAYVCQGSAHAAVRHAGNGIQVGKDGSVDLHLVHIGLIRAVTWCTFTER